MAEILLLPVALERLMERIDGDQRPDDGSCLRPAW